MYTASEGTVAMKTDVENENLSSNSNATEVYPIKAAQLSLIL